MALADLVSMSDSITDLRLAWNDIEGDVSTVSSQHTMEAVTADNSNQCPFVNQGAVAFGESLSSNLSLTSIHISHNRLGNAGAQALGHAIGAPHASLMMLNLQANGVTPAAGLVRVLVPVLVFVFVLVWRRLGMLSALRRTRRYWPRHWCDAQH